MKESKLQRLYNYRIYPRDSKILTDREFVNIDDGSMMGTHWTCFIMKNNKSYYHNSFGGTLDKILLNHIPKPIIYHKFKIKVINSRLCGSYCLYFFHLIERMNYYDALIKMYFD